MAKTIQLKAEPRNASGTVASKALRKAGKVPAIIYGRHQEPQNLQLDARSLALAMSKAGGEHLLVNLEIAGAGTSLALIQAVQHHAVKRHILHLDFHALKEDEVMHTSIPVTGFGEPVGVKTGGGLLEQIIRSLEVECLPKDLPENIVIDVSAMNIGDSIHVNQVALPAGVTALTAPEAVVFHLAPPNVEADVAPAAGDAAAAPEVLKEKKPEGEGDAKKADAKK